MTLEGSVGKLPGASAEVQVRLEVRYGMTKQNHYVAQKLVDYPVASKVTTDGTFRIGVPASALLTYAEGVGHGTVDFVVFARSARKFTVEEISVAMTRAAAAGNTQAVRRVSTRVTRMPRFNGFRAMPQRATRTVNTSTGLGPSNVPYPCGNCCAWSAYGSENEAATRIGEVHVEPAVTDFYEYSHTADTTLTVGPSLSPTSGWTASGSVTRTNTIGASGGYPAARGAVWYVDGDMYYQRYSGNSVGFCGYQYKNQLDHVVGDAFQGTNQPSENPYGGCGNGIDPNGAAKMNANGGIFNTDFGVAQTYSADATVWGFTFGGGTGFTTDIYQNYANPSSSAQYVCGDAPMPDVPILYSGSY